MSLLMAAVAVVGQQSPPISATPVPATLASTAVFAAPVLLLGATATPVELSMMTAIASPAVAFTSDVATTTVATSSAVGVPYVSASTATATPVELSTVTAIASPAIAITSEVATTSVVTSSAVGGHLVSVATTSVATVTLLGAAAVFVASPPYDYRSRSSQYIVDRGLHRTYSPVYMGNGRFVGGGGYIADPVEADEARIWAFKSETDFSAWLDDISSELSVQSTYGGGAVKVIKINDNGVVFHTHNIGRINSTQVACQWLVAGASLYTDSTHSLSAPSGRTQLQQTGGCPIYHVGVVRFSDDRALVAWVQDSVTKIRGFQLNTTTAAIIAQPAATTYESANVNVQMCALDESTVALAAHLSSGDIVARVLSVSSGAVVTVGADNTQSVGATDLKLLPIDSTHAYAIYTNADEDQVYSILTISGDTVTFGSETFLWSRGFNPGGPEGDCCYLGANKYGLVESAAYRASTERIFVFARNTGTNALTFESSRRVADTALTNPSIFRVDDTHFGVGWLRSSGVTVASTTGYIPRVQVYETEFAPSAVEFIDDIGINGALAASATGTTLATTDSMPSGVVPGDILVMQVAANAADTITTPTGYTAIVPAVSNATLSHGWYWRPADGTSADTPTVTFSTTATSTHGHFARIYAFHNAELSAPFEDASVSAITTSTTPTGDAVATSGPNRLEVHLVVTEGTPTWSSGSPPSGYAAMDRESSTSGADVMMDGIYQTRLTSDAGSAPTLGTLSGSQPWAVLSFALRPPTATPATVATSTSIGAPFTVDSTPTPTTVATTSTVTVPVLAATVPVSEVVTVSSVGTPTLVATSTVLSVEIATTSAVGLPEVAVPTAVVATITGVGAPVVSVGVSVTTATAVTVTAVNGPTVSTGAASVMAMRTDATFRGGFGFRQYS